MIQYINDINKAFKIMKQILKITQILVAEELGGIYEDNEIIKNLNFVL